MNTEKLEQILSTMNRVNIPQLLISDPAVIYYLTGVSIQPGERIAQLMIAPVVLSRFLPSEELGSTDRGEGGFGYDPYFEYLGGETFAEMGAAEKNRISHRALALRAMLPYLEEL